MGFNMPHPHSDQWGAFPYGAHCVGQVGRRLSLSLFFFSVLGLAKVSLPAGEQQSPRWSARNRRNSECRTFRLNHSLPTTLLCVSI